MKKVLIVLSLVLLLVFALVSCEEGLPEGVLQVMGKMGNNVLGVDTSKVEGAAEKANFEPSASEIGSGEAVELGENTSLTLDSANGELVISCGDANISISVGGSLDGVGAIVKPASSEELASVVSVLESSAKEEMKAQLAELVDDEQQDALENTAAVIDAVLDSIVPDDTSDEVKSVMSTIKESFATPPEGGYTKADSLVMQSAMNLVVEAAETLSSIEDTSSASVSSVVNSLNSDLMTLMIISNNSGSSLSLDFESILSAMGGSV